MEKTGNAIILIILGLIVLAFPLLGVIPFSVLTGVAVLFLGLGLLFMGAASMGESLVMGIIELILGFLALIFGLGFIFNPALFSFVAALFVFIAGIFLIIAGIVAIAAKTTGSRWTGLVALILGIIYIIVAAFIKDPLYLGILIGLWLLITGIIMLFQKD
ncbi:MULTISPECIES: DUF308 domain-containing protein [Methanobacterium]|jgi:uncharacterized membrane protein HdeD (DUF308 family)|uniref:DUF308 domain-containing protein n=1 Tax=Methanobacterium veterum TaxID=408577 RepID=A0A9E5A581_9EURY|nr:MULTISPECIES: DUF308 domain-containing protein [Methanobacterium]MCZ3366315.1 DUF308 domain-containing protein [Methanobacterium veterum]MCZ3371823.1 DUF308 domain-containing protein [Methanobacterium veterum]